MYSREARFVNVQKKFYMSSGMRYTGGIGYQRTEIENQTLKKETVYERAALYHPPE